MPADPLGSVDRHRSPRRPRSCARSSACVGDAAFAYVNAFRAHVNVGFFHGAALPDPARLLQGSGKFMRHVKLRPGVAVDDSALDVLIEIAYRDIRARLAVPG